MTSFRQFRTFLAESTETIIEPVVTESEDHKEYTVVADISHPFNRGLSVTKHFKHKAASPEHAEKAAKEHIKSQGWKVHSAKARPLNESYDDAIDLLEAIEEANQIDEVSKDTLKRYVNKAVTATYNHGNSAGSAIENDDVDGEDKHYSKYKRRQKGVATAVKKLTEELGIEENSLSIDEAVDLIDEISKATLVGYVSKAVDSVDRNAWKSGYYGRGTDAADGKAATKFQKKVDKRGRGIEKAVDKLSGTAKVPATSK